MTNDELRAAVIDELGNIAPETDAATIDPNDDLREALDIDSLDFLNFLAALHERLGGRFSTMAVLLTPSYLPAAVWTKTRSRRCYAPAHLSTASASGQA